MNRVGGVTPQLLLMAAGAVGGQIGADYFCNFSVNRGLSITCCSCQLGKAVAGSTVSVVLVVYTVPGGQRGEGVMTGSTGITRDYVIRLADVYILIVEHLVSERMMDMLVECPAIVTIYTLTPVRRTQSNVLCAANCGLGWVKRPIGNMTEGTVIMAPVVGPAYQGGNIRSSYTAGCIVTRCRSAAAGWRESNLISMVNGIRAGMDAGPVTCYSGMAVTTTGWGVNYLVDGGRGLQASVIEAGMAGCAAVTGCRALMDIIGADIRCSRSRPCLGGIAHIMAF